MLIVILIAAIIAAGDQFFKSWIVGNIALGEQLDFIPKIVHLTYVENRGAAFSMLEDMRLLLLIITGLCIVAIIVFAAISKLKPLGKISLGFILGGAVGNAIDRVLLGYVVDMFELEFMEYAVFNVADCFIVVGGILFCVYYLFLHKPEGGKKGKKKAKGEEENMETPELDALLNDEPVRQVPEDTKPIPSFADIQKAAAEKLASMPKAPEKKPEVKAPEIKKPEAPKPQPKAEEVKTSWTETEILEEYSFDQILKDYYDKMD